MRVEGDAGGQKVQRSSNTSQALVQPSPQMLLPTPATTQNPLQNILLGLLGSQGAQNPLQMPQFAGGNLFPGTSPPNQVPSMQLPSLALGQPSTASSTAMPPQLPSSFAPTIAPMPPQLQTDQMKAATVAPHIHQITYPQATAPTSGGNPYVVDSYCACNPILHFESSGRKKVQDSKGLLILFWPIGLSYKRRPHWVRPFPSWPRRTFNKRSSSNNSRQIHRNHNRIRSTRRSCSNPK